MGSSMSSFSLVKGFLIIGFFIVTLSKLKIFSKYKLLSKCSHMTKLFFQSWCMPLHIVFTVNFPKGFTLILMLRKINKHIMITKYLLYHFLCIHKDIGSYWWISIYQLFLKKIVKLEPKSNRPKTLKGPKNTSLGNVLGLNHPWDQPPG